MEEDLEKRRGSNRATALKTMITCRDMNKIRVPSLTCGLQSARALSEENTEQNMDKRLRMTNTQSVHFVEIYPPGKKTGVCLIPHGRSENFIIFNLFSICHWFDFLHPSSLTEDN